MNKSHLLASCFLFFLITVGFSNNYSIDFTDCYLEDCSSFENDSLVKFGYLTVPEDPDKPEARKLKLAFVLIKPHSPDQLPDPLIYMSGGPGGSAISEGAIRQFRSFSFAHNRDVVLLDFRGTGLSEPFLNDTLQERLLETLLGEFTGQEAEKATIEVFEHFFDEFLREGYNPNMYNTKMNVQDMEALRNALGYQTWNIFGVSYGTRTGQTYVRDFPAAVRSQILDSPVTMGVSILGQEPDSYRESLQSVFTACRNDPECNQAFPALEERFFRAMESLKKDPMVFKSEIAPDGVVYIGFKDMHLIVHQLLYNRSFYSTFPWMIIAIEEQDHVFFENITLPLINRFMGLQQWIYMLTTKYDSGLFPINASPGAEDPLYGALNYFHNLDRFLEKMDFVVLDSLEILPVSTEIPTLILVGDFDPITRPSNAIKLKSNIPSAYLYTFPGTGHGVVFSTACGENIAYDFLKDPYSAPDSSCLKTMMNTREINWITDLYYNPRVASLFMPYFRDGKIIQFAGPAMITVVFLFSFFAGIVQLLRKRGTAIRSSIRERNLVSRITAFITVLFFGLIVWFTIQTAGKGAVILTGLISASKPVFWIAILVFAGTLLSLMLYLKTFGKSRWGGRIQFGLLILGLIWSCVVIFQYQLFPGSMI